MTLSRLPIPPEPSPEESRATIKVLNMLRTCPYVSLEFAAEFYQVEDIEQLVTELMEIGNFTNGTKE